MGSYAITAGDDLKISIQLTKQDQVFTINPTATVQAAFVSADGTVTGPVAVTEIGGSDWANSLIVVSMPSATSTTLPVGRATLEIEIDDNGKTTWHVDHYYVKQSNV